MLPVSTISIVIRWICSDKGRELFKPIIKDNPSGKRYMVRGDSLIEVLKLIDQGNFKI